MLKRIFDFILALIGLVVLFPLLLICALAIKLTSPGPVFYRGLRIGLHGKPFHVFKFRSMVVNAEKLGGITTSADDKRVTKAGMFLRKYKLDELPQLINVLAGDMSFVGPRPEVASEVDQYDVNARRLLTVRPGITDYSSIKFRNEGEIVSGYSDPHKAYKELIQPEKIRLGLYYVNTHNFWVDIKLILKTVAVIVFKNRQ